MSAVSGGISCTCIYNRELTVSNLCEAMVHLHGEAVALELGVSSWMGEETPGALSFRRLLHLVNKIAYVLIAHHDLRKGERVVFACRERPTALAIFLAVTRAGGIAVPLSPWIPGPLARKVAERCRPALFLADLPLDEGVGTCFPGLGKRRFPVRESIYAGASDGVPGFGATLREGIRGAPDFFHPYTIKPQDVVALCYAGIENAPVRGTMVTSRGMVAACRIFYPLLRWFRGREAVISPGIEEISGLVGCAVSLTAGLRLAFYEDGNGLAGLKERSKAALLVGDWEALRRFVAGRGSSPLIWVCPEAFSDEREAESQTLPRASLLSLEGFGFPETAGWVAMRLSGVGPFVFGNDRIFPLPHYRFKVRDDGGRLKRKGEGELLVKGSPLTHGYWNDLEETRRRLKAGWFHTGVRVERSFLGLLRPRWEGAKEGERR